MIITLSEKYDVSPEWFEEQAKREDGWVDKLCELLSVYKVHDEAGAREAAKKLFAAGVDAEKVKAAME